MTHASKPTKKRTPKQTGSAPSASSQPVTNTGDTSTSPEWFGAQTRDKFSSKVVEAQVLSQGELMDREVLRTLEPLMSSQDKLKYHDQMHPPKDAHLSRLGAEIRRSLGGTVMGRD